MVKLYFVILLPFVPPLGTRRKKYAVKQLAILDCDEDWSIAMNNQRLHLQGACIFASGSPFGEVTINVGGQVKTFKPGQCNNSYIFPGVGLAITACKLRPIPDECFAVAADVSRLV